MIVSGVLDQEIGVQLLQVVVYPRLYYDCISRLILHLVSIVTVLNHAGGAAIA